MDLADEYERICPGRGKVAAKAAAKMRPWVARLTSLHPTMGFERRFEQPKWDWRGDAATLRYTLIEGCVYEIDDEKGRRYVRVVDGKARAIKLEEARLWASAA